MSLDITLVKRFVAEDGEEIAKELYEGNITNNCIPIAKRCGVFHALWKPNSIGAKKAHHIYGLVDQGLTNLVDYSDFYKKFEDPTWGTVDEFLSFLTEYRRALNAHPMSDIIIE